MLLCDHILFWARHHASPVFSGNLDYYVRFGPEYAMREPTIRRRLKRLKRRRQTQ